MQSEGASNSYIHRETQIQTHMPVHILVHILVHIPVHILVQAGVDDQLYVEKFGKSFAIGISLTENVLVPVCNWQIIKVKHTNVK